jgi:Ca2+-binding EF-hand superfamily protein
MDKKTKTVKTTKKGKKSKKGKDDDKAAKEEEARRLMYAEIMEKTELSEEAIAAAHKDFKNNYPKGGITMDEFMDQSEVGFLAESLFKAFDKENKGTLDFLSYMFSSNVTLSSPTDKLDWIFTAFDKDGGGTIDVGEIRDIVEALFKMAGIDEEEDLVVACVTDINKAVDSDGDGEITKEEFVKNALKSRFLKNMLKN